MNKPIRFIDQIGVHSCIEFINEPFAVGRYLLIITCIIFKDM